MSKVCCFTGHRPDKLYGYDIYSKEYIKLATIIRNYIVKELIPKGYDTFITGGALGFDTVMFLVIKKLKKQYSNIKNIVAVPFKNQPIKWSSSDKERYYNMLREADSVVYIDEIKIGEESKRYNVAAGVYCKEKMYDRNHYMVDISNFIIGAWNGSKSGTKECLDYAKVKKIKGIYIDPKTLVIYDV